MFCIDCGCAIPAEAAFCSACGKPVAGGVHSVPAPGTLRCPFCQSTSPFEVKREVGRNGMIVMIAMLIVFFPLFWIGLLVKEDVHYCSSCHLKIGTSPIPPVRYTKDVPPPPPS